MREALEAGAAGYLLKQSASDELLEAIRETDKGGASFSHPIFRDLLKERWGSSPESDVATTGPPTLTTRQAEVLQLIAEGHCNKEIAALMFLSTKTVEKHRQSLMVRLNIHKTSVLTRYAVSNGIVEVNRTPPWPSRPSGAHTWMAEKKHAWM